MALPSYRHVPGLTPHPVKAPEGHSYGGMQIDLGSRVDELPISWRDCEAYLLGVDLFNQGYFWESHEAWEEIWNAVGHQTLPGRMLQGMIQVAAALLRHHVGSVEGGRGNFRKASVHFDAVEGELDAIDSRQTSYMGVPLEQWRSEVADFLSGATDQRPFLKLRPA